MLKKLIMCAACAETMETAGYTVKEEEECEKREKCFWCRKAGYFSWYRVRREERHAQSERE